MGPSLAGTSGPRVVRGKGLGFEPGPRPGDDERTEADALPGAGAGGVERAPARLLPAGGPVAAAGRDASRSTGAHSRDRRVNRRGRARAGGGGAPRGAGDPAPPRRPPPPPPPAPPRPGP